MKKIKFIYFDLGGVVVHLGASQSKMAKRINVSLQRIEETFDKFWERACRGQINSVDYFKLLQKELDFSHPARDFADFWSETLVPIRETHSLILELLPKYALGIISNVEPGVFEKTVEKGAIPKIKWSAVVKSSDIGFVKPEEQIFKIAQRQAGVRHEEIMLIDDRRLNLEAAAKLGWESIQFEENKPQKSIKKIREKLQQFGL